MSGRSAMHAWWRLIAALALLAGLTGTALSAPDRSDREITVMTRNVYLGFDLDSVVPAIISGDPAQIIAAVTQGFAAVQATDFPQRARALAREIEETQPDVIGLQEMVLWRSQSPGDFLPVPNAVTVEYDFLQLLLAALAERGLEYRVVTAIQGMDAELPALEPNGACCRDIRLTFRDVMLLRTAPGEPPLHVTGVQAGNYVAAVEVGGLRLPRSWIAADVKLRGRSFRVITTHLDPAVPAVRLAQAQELMSGPAFTTLPLVLVCDCNSGPGGSIDTYNFLIASGFADAWPPVQGPGFTCCQAPDLLNPVSLLSQRIDLILIRNGFTVRAIGIVGDDPEERTTSGLWPSDHAGVVAILGL